MTPGDTPIHVVRRWFPCFVLHCPTIAGPTHLVMAASDRVSINEALPLLQDVVEWEELGFHLGLSDAAIKEIRAMVGETVSIKRMVMMSRWVQSDLEATWSKLAKALLKMNPPYKVLAAKIRQQYSCPSSEASVTHQDGQKERQEPNGEKCKFICRSNSCYFLYNALITDTMPYSPLPLTIR